MTLERIIAGMIQGFVVGALVELTSNSHDVPLRRKVLEALEKKCQVCDKKGNCKECYVKEARDDRKKLISRDYLQSFIIGGITSLVYELSHKPQKASDVLIDFGVIQASAYLGKLVGRGVNNLFARKKIARLNEVCDYLSKGGSVDQLIYEGREAFDVFIAKIESEYANGREINQNEAYTVLTKILRSNPDLEFLNNEFAKWAAVQSAKAMAKGKVRYNINEFFRTDTNHMAEIGKPVLERARVYELTNGQIRVQDYTWPSTIGESFHPPEIKFVEIRPDNGDYGWIVDQFMCSGKSAIFARVDKMPPIDFLRSFIITSSHVDAVREFEKP
jgi:hypothetical protein